MARVKKRLTYDLLVYHFNYNPLTGSFTWRKPRVKWISPGDKAGWENLQGYRNVKIYGYTYSVGRLAWLYMTGKWPSHEIDHENHIRCDNRWENLREATRAQNMQNARKRNKLGFPGVSESEGGFTARATVSGVRTYLGFFTDLEDAAEAVATARIADHKDFACLEVM